jgi:hypothetical protein
MGAVDGEARGVKGIAMGSVLRQSLAALVFAASICRAGPAAKADGPGHPGDYRTCPVCKQALEKSMGYLKGNLQKSVLSSVWYAEMLGSFYGGFAFLMEGNSQKEAKQCADHICKYFDWAKHHMGYEGWFCSMSMAYLTEYSLRYGATPEIKAKLEWGAKWVHKTREKEGGWFHGPRWGQGNYALDISSVGCGYFMALEEMRVLGMETGPALDDVRDYASRVCDGRSVAYGLWGKGGFSLGASGYILIGLTSSGQKDDPRVAGIGGFLKEHYRDVRKAHACGYLHHFGVAAALHRVGPEAYGPFAQYYLHELIIPNQRPDGSIGSFPNDNGDPAPTAYASMKENGDFACTAVLASMILLERPGAFSPNAVKKKDAISNKEAFRLASEALAKGDTGKAYRYFAEVLPLGDSEELVPQAQEQLKKLEAPIRERVKEAQDKEAKDIAEAKALADAKDYRGALALYDGVIKSYADLTKQYAGVPFVDDLKRPLEELKKAAAPLKTSLVFSSGGKTSSTPASKAAADNTPANAPATPATAIAPQPALGKLKDPELLKVWEGKLKTRVQSVLKTGGKPRFDFKALKQRMLVVAMDDQGAMKAGLEQGGQMDLRWAQLQPADWHSLAINLAQAQDTPADHALAAFFDLYHDRKEQAEQHLDKAGPDAAAVKDAFAAP